MRTHLALSFASVVILAFASGCSAESKEETPADVAAPTTPVAAPPVAAAAAPNAPEASNDSAPPAKSTAEALTIVHGKFAEPTAAALDNARALAITDDQTTYSSYLDAKGEFTLSLPVGESYRIVFVNQLAGGGQVKIGHIDFNGSEWFGANTAGELDLGSVSVSGKVETSTTDHANDPASTKDDGRTLDGAKNDDGKNIQLDAINVCLIWPSVALHSSVDISSTFGDSKFEAHSEISTDAHDDDKSCAKWNSTTTGAITWGAPWSVQANGQVVLAGGLQIQSSISGGFQSNFGFGSGFYGGYSSSYTSAGFYGGYYGGYSSSFGFSSTYSGSFNSSWTSSFGGSASGSISGGWSVGVSGGSSGSVCVTAQTCGADSSCTAGTCQKR